MPRRTPEATAELRASLLADARALVERDGARGLTMRALAAEAECAVGLPYKVFANRQELVAELVLGEFERLRQDLDRWVAAAGTGTVGGNLAQYARMMLDSSMPVWTMVGEVGDAATQEAAAATAGPSALLDSFHTTVRDYLATEQRLGRIAADVDVDAFGFLITGAIHNLLSAGPGYPRPSRRKLERTLEAVVARLTALPSSAPVH